MNELELKYNGVRERLSSYMQEAEDRVLNLRVQVTIAKHQLEELSKENAEQKERIETLEKQVELLSEDEGEDEVS